MKTIYRIMAEHAGVCKIFLTLTLICITLAGFGNENVSFLSVYFLGLVLLFLGSRFINSAPAKLLEEPVQILEQQCDPTPLLQELEHQMARKDYSPARQLTELNYAMVLRTVGENYKCADVLENLNIDRFPSTTPYTKFIYYNNLADVLFALERDQEARIWHRKSLQIYNDLPENKVKQQFSQTVQLSEAEAAYHSGDPDKALRKAAWIKFHSKRQLLDAALLAARCHIALEEPEKAKEKLNYVIEQGNKLHIVQEAAELLETLNGSAPNTVGDPL